MRRKCVKAAKPLMKQGATGVRIEIGGGDVQADAERVREISDGLGDDAWVGVAADGRFDLGTAQALAHFFEDIGIDWFEDPIPASRRDRLREARGADGDAAGGRKRVQLARSVLPRDPRRARPHDPPRRRAGSAASRRC